jgi:hypothetical protein
MCCHPLFKKLLGTSNIELVTMETLGYIYQNPPPAITIEPTRIRCILQDSRTIARLIAKITTLKARHKFLITVTLEHLPKIGKPMIAHQKPQPLKVVKVTQPLNYHPNRFKMPLTYP